MTSRASFPTPCSPPCRPTPLIWAVKPAPVALDVGPRPPWSGPNPQSCAGAMNRPDPRSPLVLDTRELDRRPGTMLEIPRTVDRPEDLGTDVIAITPAARRARAAARVRRRGRAADWLGTRHGERRLRAVPGSVTRHVEGHFQELFAYADRAAHHHEVATDDDEDEVYELVGDLFDLEPVLRDAMVPACRSTRVPERLSGAVLRVRSAPGGRPDAPP